MSATAPEKGLYGGWRKRRPMGVGYLNTTQTFVLVAAVLWPVVVVNIGGGLASLLLTVPISLVVMTVALWQYRGMPLLTYARHAALWRWAATRGETSYRSVFLPSPEALDLPGLAAPTKLVRADTPTGPVGLVWNQRTGTMTAGLLLSPGGALLAHGPTVTTSVRAWGDVLAGFADQELVQAASVTLQITPSSGAALSDHVRGRLDKASPQIAQDTMRELVARAPSASADLKCWMSLTIDPMRAAQKPKNPAESGAAVLDVLNGVDLAGAGADIVRRCTDDDIKRLVRGSFCPPDMDAPAQRWSELMWHEVGPVATEDRADVYEHDGCYSVSYVLREAPRKLVPYDVLLKLLAPGRYPRRVTLAYRTLPTEEGAAVAEREITAADARADYRRRTKRDETRRDRMDHQLAERNAAQEAAGAGIVQWSLYLTTTVTDRADLQGARRELEQAARACGGLRIRPAYHAQSAGFAIGLPLGVTPLLA